MILLEEPPENTPGHLIFVFLQILATGTKDPAFYLFRIIRANDRKDSLFFVHFCPHSGSRDSPCSITCCPAAGYERMPDLFGRGIPPHLSLKNALFVSGMPSPGRTGRIPAPFFHITEDLSPFSLKNYLWHQHQVHGGRGSR